METTRRGDIGRVRYGGLVALAIAGALVSTGLPYVLRAPIGYYECVHTVG